MTVCPSSLLTAAIHLQNKRVHGPSVDYLAIVLSSFASWIGVPGPGEAVVVTAGILASKGRLNLGPVIFYAWLGASAGGVGGWLVGRIAGRPLFTIKGPLLRYRKRAVRESERLYDRYGAIAVFLTPSWGAGIARMGTVRYLLANSAAAAVWAITLGLGSYLIGPSIADFFDELGLAGITILVIVVAGGAAIGAVRRRRRRAR